MLMKYALLLAVGCGIWSCKKLDMPDGNIMPPTLDFVLLDSGGNNLLTSLSTPIQVFGIKSNGQPIFLGAECAGGECTMIREANQSSAIMPKYSFYYSSLGASLSSESGVKTWYIKLDGKTDTLYYDVQKTRPNDRLYKYDTKAVIFNGQVARQEDPGQPPLYVFRRKR